MTERDMVLVVVERLREADIRVALEVPFMSQSIDMVYEETPEKLVAIEFKRYDWGRALAQCKTHLLGADEVYICLLHREPPEKLQDEVAKLGVGLLLFDPAAPNATKVHTEATEITTSLNFPREWLREAFEQRWAQGDS